MTKPSELGVLPLDYDPEYYDMFVDNMVTAVRSYPERAESIIIGLMSGMVISERAAFRKRLIDILEADAGDRDRFIVNALSESMKGQ